MSRHKQNDKKFILILFLFLSAFVMVLVWIFRERTVSIRAYSLRLAPNATLSKMVNFWPKSLETEFRMYPSPASNHYITFVSTNHVSISFICIPLFYFPYREKKNGFLVFFFFSTFISLLYKKKKKKESFSSFSCFLFSFRFDLLVVHSFYFILFFISSFSHYFLMDFECFKNKQIENLYTQKYTRAHTHLLAR